MAAPRRAARHASPTDPNSRSPTGRGAPAPPSTTPMVLLRDTPTSTGQPRRAPRRSVSATRRRFSAGVLPKPKPASTITSATPCARARATDAASDAATRSTTSAGPPASRAVWAWPPMRPSACITTSGAPASAAARAVPTPSRSPLTSLTRCAPAASAARATAPRRVSTETRSWGTARTTASTAGTTRASSSSRPTGAAPAP